MPIDPITLPRFGNYQLGRPRPSGTILGDSPITSGQGPQTVEEFIKKTKAEQNALVKAIDGPSQNAFLPNTGFFGKHPRFSSALEAGIAGAANTPPARTVGEGIQNVARSIIGTPLQLRQMRQARTMEPLVNMQPAIEIAAEQQKAQAVEQQAAMERKKAILEERKHLETVRANKEKELIERAKQRYTSEKDTQIERLAKGRRERQKAFAVSLATDAGLDNPEDYEVLLTPDGKDYVSDNKGQISLVNPKTRKQVWSKEFKVNPKGGRATTDKEMEFNIRAKALLSREAKETGKPLRSLDKLTDQERENIWDAVEQIPVTGNAQLLGMARLRLAERASTARTIEARRQVYKDSLGMALAHLKAVEGDIWSNEVLATMISDSGRLAALEQAYYDVFQGNPPYSYQEAVQGIATLPSVIGETPTAPPPPVEIDEVIEMMGLEAPKENESTDVFIQRLLDTFVREGYKNVPTLQEVLQKLSGGD